jgi:hypothetical protein
MKLDQRPCKLAAKNLGCEITEQARFCPFPKAVASCSEAAGGIVETLPDWTS